MQIAGVQRPSAQIDRQLDASHLIKVDIVLKKRVSRRVIQLAVALLVFFFPL
jgi:RNA-binding protein YhbY